MYACNKADSPEMYDLFIGNQYFERIDSLFLNSNRFDGIEVGSELFISNIKHGNHELQIYTQSSLKIQITLKLIGTNPVVKVVINKNGKVLITD
jgi:hypothetical protein